jgi:hypothetical protein
MREVLGFIETVISCCIAHFRAPDVSCELGLAMLTVI